MKRNTEFDEEIYVFITYTVTTHHVHNFTGLLERALKFKRKVI